MIKSIVSQVLFIKLENKSRLFKYLMINIQIVCEICCCTLVGVFFNVLIQMTWMDTAWEASFIWFLHILMNWFKVFDIIVQIGLIGVLKGYWRTKNHWLSAELLFEIKGWWYRSIMVWIIQRVKPIFIGSFYRLNKCRSKMFLTKFKFFWELWTLNSSFWGYCTGANSCWGTSISCRSSLSCCCCQSLSFCWFKWLI